LIADPSKLPALIAENAKLTAASKDPRVQAIVNQNNIKLAAIVREQSKKLTSLIPLTRDAFMKVLLRNFSTGEGVDWVDFGVNVSAYFREVPVTHGLYHMCVEKGRGGGACRGARRGRRSCAGALRARES
jgi:hypothetical protein